MQHRFWTKELQKAQKEKASWLDLEFILTDWSFAKKAAIFINQTGLIS